MAEQQAQSGAVTTTTAARLHASNLWEPVSAAPPPPERVLDADAKTPDDWVPRSPELIRLTGEAPTSHGCIVLVCTELTRAQAGIR